MITNFEHITADLNERDKLFEPFVLAVLKNATKPTKAPDVVEQVNYMVASQVDPSEAKFTDVRLRKFVNYFRSEGIIPVCATSEGYFVSTSQKVLYGQIQSLEERASGIMAAATGLKKFLQLKITENESTITTTPGVHVTEEANPSSC